MASHLFSSLCVIKLKMWVLLLTRLTSGSPRPARKVILTWCFFSTQLSTCFSLVVRSWAAMPKEKLSSFTCTGAAERKQVSLSITFKSQICLYSKNKGVHSSAICLLPPRWYYNLHVGPLTFQLLRWNWFDDYRLYSDCD